MRYALNRRRCAAACCQHWRVHPEQQARRKALWQVASLGVVVALQCRRRLGCVVIALVGLLPLPLLRCLRLPIVLQLVRLRHECAAAVTGRAARALSCAPAPSRVCRGGVLGTGARSGSGGGGLTTRSLDAGHLHVVERAVLAPAATAALRARVVVGEQRS